MALLAWTSIFPEVDNAALWTLEPALNDLIREGFEVNALCVVASEAATTPGLIRSLTAAPPPTPSGMLRAIDIVGVDRQVCGGTHLTNTAQSAPVQITRGSGHEVEQVEKQPR